MNRFLCSRCAWLSVVLLVFSLNAFADPEPLVYWSFDNPSDLGHDDSGHGHSLTIPEPATSVTGAMGNGVSFSGYGVGHTYFDRGYNPTSSPWGPYTSTSSLDYPGTNGLTVSYWTKIESGKQAIVWDYWQHRAAGETFGLEYKQKTGQASFFVRADFTDPAPKITAPVNAAVGSWVHLAGVYEPSGYGLKLYVNGQLAAQGNMPAPIRTQRAPYFYVAGSWHQTNPAKLDEVRLYNTALSATEVKALFAPTPPSKSKTYGVFGLIALGTLCGLTGCLLAFIAHRAKPVRSVLLGLVTLIAAIVFFVILWVLP